MGEINIVTRLKSAWEDVAMKVNKAVVFMDSASAETLHWNAGPQMLFNAGASNIKEFSSFECGLPSERKAVFVLSGPLTGMTQQILSDIVQASSFYYVIVVTSLCPAMHSLAMFGSSDNEMKAFHYMEDKLLKWMGNANYTVELFYMPVVCAPVTRELFLLPEHSQLFPLLPSDIETLAKVNQKERDSSGQFTPEYTHLSKEAQLQMKLLVCSLNSMLCQLNVVEDCYSLGSTSRILASELASLTWAKARRKVAQNKATLLLVDRTLDLANVTGHHTETLLDRVTSLLPRLPGHTSDVAVNMAPVCTIPIRSDTSILAPGCLAHPLDGQATALLYTLAFAKHKEALMEVNRQLVEAATSRGLPVTLAGRPGRVNHQQLQATIDLFRGNIVSVCKHSGVLQLSQAAAHTLAHPRYGLNDSLLGVEKGLLLCLGDADSPSVLQQIATTINKQLGSSKPDKSYSLEDMFVLLVYVYSLLEPSDALDGQHERMLKSALEGAIMESNCLPEFLQELIGADKSEEKVFRALEDIFVKLKALALARQNLKQFDSIFEAGGMTSVSSLKPLMKQVMEQIFDSKKPELHDVEYKSTGFRDLLKSGFGLFMNVSKPRPSDHPLLIVFVVGGITSTEARQIRETVAASNTNTQVLIGSTSLLNTRDILHNVFVQDNLHPSLHAL